MARLLSVASRLNIIDGGKYTGRKMSRPGEVRLGPCGAGGSVGGRAGGWVGG